MALSSPGRGPGSDDARLDGISLCAGAGGLDLGLHIACSGYRTVGYVEREAFAAATLVARMEDKALDPAPVWDDLTTFDGRPWRGLVDILTAGYPCQPFSVAGRRLGEADPRHLWPHVARIIRECDPRLVFLENVANHLRLGFPEVARELVGMGYVLAAGLFTAAEVGAPHRRERLFILAVRDGDELADTQGNHGWAELETCRTQCGRTGPAGSGGPVADADGERREQAECGQPQECGSDTCCRNVDDPDCPGLQGWVDQSCQCAGERPAWPPGPDDADAWEMFLRHAPDLEPTVRRGADGLAHRVDRLRLCGNGVVPLVAAHALRTLASELVRHRETQGMTDETRNETQAYPSEAGHG
ncbi:DNA methyltransferase [Sphingobium baderi LL03]|uniref:DNA (cytosine-5-)-methyltransferase n=1 Tax=Sphingobium baderi LL03 TaxID=1114964 RepID=T0HHS7_9SPHN|nr:DNA methyltransferase [Sphingobium baderi LL03]